MQNNSIVGRRSLFARAAVSVVLLLASSAAAAAPQIRDLGTLGGNSSFARDINEAGQIVGEAALANGQTHAFILTPWVSSRLVDLGTLGGPSSQALGISNRGQVVGSSEVSATGGETRAFLWDQGRMTALPPLNGASFSQASDVNDAGVVVGASGGVAVRWVNGRVQSLGTLGGESSFATGINSSGVIVGNGATSSGDFHGWVFEGGTLRDLGTFGGVRSTAEGINSSGDIVGHFETAAGVIHGYLLRRGAFRDLGALDQFSGANAIANSGVIAGEGGGGAVVHGVLWNESGALVDLGALPGSNFSSAASVNSSSTAVGVSATAAGLHAVVWR
jgi:probable HAF family extracellular repeat protein